MAVDRVIDAEALEVGHHWGNFEVHTTVVFIVGADLAKKIGKFTLVYQNSSLRTSPLLGAVSAPPCRHLGKAHRPLSPTFFSMAQSSSAFATSDDGPIDWQS